MAAWPLRERDGYLPIADYGAIGNLRTVALVGRNGSIDWCCLPDLDSPSVFAGILDRRRGGRFRLAPAVVESANQRYIPDTNVLETTLDGPRGRVSVTDFMPLATGTADRREGAGPPVIYRLVKCEEGEVDLELEWAPRLDYARAAGRVRAMGARFEIGTDAAGMTLVSTAQGAEVVEGVDGAPVVHGCFRMRAGERQVFVTWWNAAEASPDFGAAERALHDTVGAWRRWVSTQDFGENYAFAGRWRDQAVRSGLALKLLTHAHTGGIVAAATTSLPEQIGGVRNWDYRYAWIRDASFTAQAFFALGHTAEGLDLLHWAQRASKYGAERAFSLQIMYGIDGSTELPETVLEHLEGYRGSRPVRIGNAAARQQQHDIYGELLNAADGILFHQGSIDPDLWGFLTAVADRACEVWRQPDYGIWEVRKEPEHFTYSKVMIWVALDRAMWLAQHYGLPGHAERWGRTAAEVRDAVLTYGYDPQVGAFVRSLGSTELDSANLLIPMLEFLPFDDPRVQGTINCTLDRLLHDGMVYRYQGEDGLPGHEGAFGLSTFWLIDALAMSGRLDQAHDLFARMIGRANHLGLYSEEILPTTGEFLGNFPQAFTHVGFINSLLYLALAEGRPMPFPAPLGSPRHAQERGHETAGG